MIRSLASRVPAAAPARVFVAEDDDGLAAVVSWREVGGPGEVHLDVIGVALRHRRTGGQVARAVARAALDEIQAAAIEAGADELYVEGEVYELNDASLALSEDLSLNLFEQHPTGAQTWNARVPLAGAEVLDVDDEPT